MNLGLVAVAGGISLIAVLVIAFIQRATTYPPSNPEDEELNRSHPNLFERCRKCKRLIAIWDSKVRKYTCQYCGEKQEI